MLCIKEVCYSKTHFIWEINCNFFFQFCLVRNTAPNQPYFRKSPSPSAPSPMGLPNQMVPSPALVPSPQVTNIMTQRNGNYLKSPFVSFSFSYFLLVDK